MQDNSAIVEGFLKPKGWFDSNMEWCPANYETLEAPTLRELHQYLLLYQITTKRNFTSLAINYDPSDKKYRVFLTFDPKTDICQATIDFIKILFKDEIQRRNDKEREEFRERCLSIRKTRESLEFECRRFVQENPDFKASELIKNEGEELFSRK